MKNHRAGHVEDTHLHTYAFDEQYNTYHRYMLDAVRVALCHNSGVPARVVQSPDPGLSAASRHMLPSHMLAFAALQPTVAADCPWLISTGQVPACFAFLAYTARPTADCPATASCSKCGQTCYVVSDVHVCVQCCSIGIAAAPTGQGIIRNEVQLAGQCVQGWVGGCIIFVS